MNLPRIGQLVTVIEPAHPHVGESGRVVAYHGVLHNSVFVQFPDNPRNRDALLPADALAWEAHGVKP